MGFSMPHGYGSPQIFLNASTAPAPAAAPSKASQAPSAVVHGQLRGITPLGHSEGTFWWFSNDLGEVAKVKHKDSISSSTLLSLGGHAWCDATYGFDKKDGRAINFQRLAGDLREECLKRGPFNSDRVRGGGVWEEGGRLVVNSKDCFRGGDRHVLGRVTSKFVYSRNADLGIAPDTASATKNEVAEVLAFLKTFNTVNGDSDAKLLIGMLGCMYVPAALQRRPHAYVYGDAGSGKSLLLKLFERLLGPAALSRSNESAAGLRQALRSQSLACLLDESGTDNEQLAKLLEYLRTSADGKKSDKGGASHDQTTFEHRTVALMVGVNPIEMDTQDESRFVMVHLLEHDKATSTSSSHKQYPTEHNEDAQAALGLRIFARMIDAWPRFVSSRLMLERALTGSNRFSDTMTPVLASAYVALHDDDINSIEAAKAWIETFNLDAERERTEIVSPGQQFMQSLASTVVRTNVSGPFDMSIGQLWHRAAHATEAGGGWREELFKLGMRIDRNESREAGESSHRISFAVNNNQALRKIVDEMQGFKGVDLKKLIKRVKGATSTVKTQRMGEYGSPSTLSVPYERPSEKPSALHRD